MIREPHLASPCPGLLRVPPHPHPEERVREGTGNKWLSCVRLRARTGYLLLQHSECPPGLFAAVPAAGPRHASTYSPRRAAASAAAAASRPAPATSAATATGPARPIFAAAITPRPEPPSGQRAADWDRRRRSASERGPPPGAPIRAAPRPLPGANGQPRRRRSPGRAEPSRAAQRAGQARPTP